MRQVGSVKWRNKQINSDNGVDSSDHISFEVAY